MSLAGIVVYIAWRFEFRFGVAATIATFHDVLAVLGIVFILNKEITLLIVTALLTIAGYSLTDTVVVYDRIRENLRSRRKEQLGDIMNASINQVLSRTAMTSITTLLAALALFFLGGEVCTISPSPCSSASRGDLLLLVRGIPHHLRVAHPGGSRAARPPVGRVAQPPGSGRKAAGTRRWRIAETDSAAAGRPGCGPGRPSPPGPPPPPARLRHPRGRAHLLGDPPHGTARSLANGRDGRGRGAPAGGRGPARADPRLRGLRCGRGERDGPPGERVAKGRGGGDLRHPPPARARLRPARQHRGAGGRRGRPPHRDGGQRDLSLRSRGSGAKPPPGRPRLRPPPAWGNAAAGHRHPQSPAAGMPLPVQGAVRRRDCLQAAPGLLRGRSRRGTLAVPGPGGPGDHRRPGAPGGRESDLRRARAGPARRHAAPGAPGPGPGGGALPWMYSVIASTPTG